MEINYKRLLLNLRYLMVATAVILHIFWLNIILLFAVIGVIYLEYRISTSEQRKEMTTRLFGKFNLILAGALLLLIVLQYWFWLP